jgi:hypothetical protein
LTACLLWLLPGFKIQSLLSFDAADYIYKRNL